MATVKVICINDYKDILRGDILKCYSGDSYNGVINYDVYNQTHSSHNGGSGLTSTELNKYFIEFDNIYSTEFIFVEERRGLWGNIIKKKVTKKYELDMKNLSEENICLTYKKAISYIENIKRLDTLLLDNFKNVIIDICNNLNNILKLDDETVYLEALDNASSLLIKMYESALEIFEKAKNDDLKEVLLKQNKEIVNIYTGMFKELDKIN